MFCTDISEPVYWIFSSELPHLLYYSHIPTAITALILGFFVYFKNSKNLVNKILLLIATSFSVWNFLNLILWTNSDSNVLMFTWALFGVLNPLLFISCLYFVYVYIDQKDVSSKLKLIWGVLSLPSIALASQYISFDLINCEVSENRMYANYVFGLELLIFFWILVLLINRHKKARAEFKKQILLLGTGIELFLFFFFITGFVASYLAEKGVSYAFEIEQYGLFGMTFFMGVLAYMIVKFKAFDIKLLGAQALVVTQFILIASIFTFATSTVNRILVAITLLITSGAGWFLVQSVKKEVKRKEELQRLSDSLAAANERLRQLDIEKSEFISIASHQLRTPLTAIKGYISLILEGSYGVVATSIQDVLEKVYSVNSRLVAVF